jgi:hypothetical protein
MPPTKLLATAGVTGDIRAYARKKDFKACSAGQLCIANT